uniref:PBP domain-containing protein n=1 Tax=Cyanothece sp. (strain PCC 7425 / ATCC 29141) TaxID=395961 RepID=B8HKU8_CYAP4
MSSDLNPDFNYVKCPKCGHDRNPSTARKCEICGTALKKGTSLFPLLLGGLVGLAVLGTGFWWLKSLLSGPSTNSPGLSSSVSPQVPEDTASNATQAQHSQLKGAVIQSYTTFADVPNVPQGIFNYGGSTVFAPLRSPAIVQQLNQVFPQFQLRYTEPTTGAPGSGKGIEMLIAGQLSFAQSSRPIKDDEYTTAKLRGFSLDAVPIAIDGIALFVNPQLVDEGIKGLSLDQVRAIFTGKAQNWQEFGGPDRRITPLIRDLTAASDFFHESVLEKQPVGANVREARDATESIRRVARDPGGISYATASEAINQRTIRTLPIGKEGSRNFISACADPNCTTVNAPAFTDGSYPITRRLFLIIKRDGKLDEQAGVAYANLLLSNEGQKLVQQSGFVPIR